ncbi:Hypothetical protein GL50581_2819 [Giardia duodenalis ATCC 50581]|nr:Hypothetical protein GL50581_2819 [Giardia intestinalis ATCC 50581]
MFPEIATRRFRAPKDKNSLENILYTRSIICNAFPLTPKNSSDIRENIELFATLLHRGSISGLENIQSVITSDNLEFLRVVYCKSDQFLEVKAQVVISYAYLLQNLTEDMLNLLIQSEPMQDVLASALSSPNPDIRGYATASLKFIASSITVTQLSLLNVDGDYPFLIKIANCYATGEKDQQMAVKGLILASLQHSQTNRGQLPELLEWINRVLLGPFISYMCYELLVMAVDLANLSDGPCCSPHDPAKRSQIKELHEKISDILDFFLDLSSVRHKEQCLEISRIITQRLIELVIGPVILVSLQHCCFEKITQHSISWPICSFSITACLGHHSDRVATDLDPQAEQFSAPPLLLQSTGLALSPKSINSMTTSRSSAMSDSMILDGSYNEGQSISASVSMDANQTFIQRMPPVLPVHIVLILLVHIMSTFRGSTIGQYLYRIFFLDKGSVEQLQELIVCPVVTGALITIISSSNNLTRNTILSDSPDLQHQKICYGPAVVREWCEYFSRTHDSTKDPVLLRLMSRVIRKYMSISLSCGNDVLDLVLIRFFLALHAYSEECRGDASTIFASMQGPHFVSQTIASACKKHMRSVTLKQLVDLADVYKCKLDAGEVYKDASKQVEALEALATQERECQKLRLAISVEGHSPEWKMLFSEEESSPRPKKQMQHLVRLYTTLSLYQDEILSYETLVTTFKSVVQSFSPTT